jgi:tetratricopeptide (TPR) repeat protein
MLYARQDKYAEAARVFEEVVSFEKDKPEIYGYLGHALTQAKEYEKAAQVLEEAVSRFDDNDELHFALATVYEKLGRFDDMERHLKRTIELDPAHADALNYLGYSYADKGIKLEEALSLIQRALQVKPDSGYIIDSLGWVYFKLGRLEDARKTLLRARDLVKDDPVLHEHIGDVYEALGDSGKAIEAWNEALKLQEKEPGLKERVEEKIKRAESGRAR